VTSRYADRIAPVSRTTARRTSTAKMASRNRTSTVSSTSCGPRYMVNNPPTRSTAGSDPSRQCAADQIARQAGGGVRAVTIAFEVVGRSEPGHRELL
jgi:hypothetical protein